MSNKYNFGYCTFEPLMVLIRHFLNLTFIIWRKRNLIFSLCSTEECQDGLDINNENNDNFNE